MVAMAPAAVGPGRWLRRWLAPSFAALLFALNPAAVLLKPDMPVQDPGIGWHLVTGRIVLETGRPVSTDPFSFTAGGRQWVGGAWMFQVAAAWLERRGGLPLVTAACALLYGLVPVVLYRRMMAEGTPAPVAMVCGMCAYGVLAVHAMDRPHIVTYLLFACLLSALEAHRADPSRPGRLVWHVPLMAVWCNCHRGFVIGLVVTSMYCGWAILDAAVLRKRGWRPALTLAAVLMAMGAATLLNPWGWRLHTSTLEYLGMESIRLWQEYRSPNFLEGGSAVAVFECLVAALIVVMAVGKRRLDWFEALLVVFFLHWGLQSLRHMNLFAIVAAPPLARGLGGLLEGAPRLWRRLEAIASEQRACLGHRWQIPCLSAGFLWLAASGPGAFRTDFDNIWLSRGASDYIASQPERFGRMFNADETGGALIHRFWPAHRVFVDDRNEVYGDRFILGEYLHVLDGRPDWREVLDRHGVTSALVPASSVIDTLLGMSGDWQQRYRDPRNALYTREP